MRVCIIVSMYNEAAIAEHSVNTILQYAFKLPIPSTVLVVDDGSEDTTPTILTSLMRICRKEQLDVVTHARNRGYGAAQRTGISYAIEHEYDYVIFMDSDLTDHPRYFEGFYEKMIEGWDYIKTTRHAHGGGFVNVPWKRRIISKIGSIVARVVTGLPLTDLPNGFRAVKVDILKQIVLTENHFSIITEELTMARKITKNFCEIPRVQTARTDEAGSSSFTYDFETIWKYFKHLFV